MQALNAHVKIEKKAAAKAAIEAAGEMKGGGDASLVDQLVAAYASPSANLTLL